MNRSHKRMGEANNLNPSRSRPEIEWSVTMAGDRLSSDRFVIYGLEREAIESFLQSHGVDGAAAMQELARDFGAPSQVAVGSDGERTKLYWFLPSREPYFVGSDFVDGVPLPRKIYTEFNAEQAEMLVNRVDSRVREHLAWLLERPELESSKLFHLVAFRRDVTEPYAGVHLGLKPDWLGLLRKDASLLYAPLVQNFVRRLGLYQHWSEIEAAVLSAPMAWTCYLSVQVRPSGALGLTVYSRASPVVELETGLALVEPGEGGTYPRPVVVTCGHEHLPNVRLRFRFQGPARSFVRANGWFVDYGPEEGDHRTLSDTELRLVEQIAKAACHEASPRDPVGLVRGLEGMAGIRDLGVGPDLRREN